MQVSGGAAGDGAERFFEFFFIYLDWPVVGAY